MIKSIKKRLNQLKLFFRTQLIRFVTALLSLKYRSKKVLCDTKGETYIDTGVKITIAIVIGALLLAGLFALFGDTVMPTLTQKIKDLFGYSAT